MLPSCLSFRPVEGRISAIIPKEKVKYDFCYLRKQADNHITLALQSTGD